MGIRVIHSFCNVGGRLAGGVEGYAVRPKGLSGGGVLWGSQPLTQATGGAEN